MPNDPHTLDRTTKPLRPVIKYRDDAMPIGRVGLEHLDVERRQAIRSDHDDVLDIDMLLSRAAAILLEKVRERSRRDEARRQNQRVNDGRSARNPLETSKVEQYNTGH